MSGCLLPLGFVFTAVPLVAFFSVFGFDRRETLLDQGAHELRSVHRCSRAVRDRRLVTYGDCSVYAQVNLRHLALAVDQRAASAACVAAVMLYAFYGEGAPPPKRADVLSGSGRAHDCHQPGLDARLVLQTLADNHVPVDSWPWQSAVRP